MKAILVVGILLVVCVVLFVAGVFSPGRSLRMQRLVEAAARKAERKGHRHAGRIGTATGRAIKRMRKVAGASARGGRKTRARARR